MLAYNTRHFPGVDEGHIPLVQLLAVTWVFEAQPTQPMTAVVYPVPIEMHHIKGLLGCSGALQSLLQRWKSRWGKHGEFGQFPQALHGFDQWQGTDAVVDVTGMGILRSRTDQ